MKIALSIKVIKTNIHALEACRCCGEPDGSLSRILMPGQDTILIAAVRQMFAEVVLRLYPWVESSGLDSETGSAYTAPAVQPAYPEDSGPVPAGENPGPDVEMLEIDLRVPQALPRGTEWVLRRNIENAVCLKTLAMLASSLGQADATKVAAGYEAAAERAILLVEATLTPVPAGVFERAGLW